MPNGTVHPECQPEYQTRHDFSTPEHLHLTIVEALAAVEDVPQTEVDPLYDVVEPESLERLFAHADARESALSTAFSVGKWSVTVHSDGRVLVHECGEAAESSPMARR